MSNEKWKEAFAYIDDKREEMLKTLEEMILTVSSGREPETVRATMPWLRSLFEAEGFVCKEISSGNQNGNTLVGVLGEEIGTKPILFSGHWDTALPQKTAAENPYRMEGDTIHGPGVLDMKGGILIALYVVKALKQIGYDKHPIKFIWSGDEEINHVDSQGAVIIQNEAKGCLCGFNMETGVLGNKICIGRKGGVRCKLKVHGVSAHAGNDFTKGRSAIVEMAHKILDIDALTDLEKGTTMNIGIIQGGTIFNAVPAECEIIVDMRFKSNAEMERAKAAVEEVSRKTYIEGTTTEMSYIDMMYVFETTPEGRKLLEHVQKAAEKYGLQPVEEISLGGSSDAANTTIAGVPTLCSCGAMGEWNHTIREYIKTESLFERAKLWIAAILELDQTEQF